jgi:hypothetical protein
MLTDLEPFVGDHRPHGTLTDDATEAARNGYPITVACPCGVTFERWVTPQEADRDFTSYSGGIVRARVRVDVEDDNWQGYVTITIPVLRYDQATVNALAQYRLQMRDYELQTEALAAQAVQYAAIKQREFIERHERLTVLNRIVFDALMRRVCMSLSRPQASYYKEIIRRCLDWTGAKIEFEPGRMDDLEFPDYPSDHFVNSPGVRFFLPVIRTAETNFFDTLMACGTFHVRLSVENARNAINGARARIQGAGTAVERLDQFSTEMVLGEHIEAVMSDHDHAR